MIAYNIPSMGKVIPVIGLALCLAPGLIAHPEHELEAQRQNLGFKGEFVSDAADFRLSVPYVTMFSDEKPWLVYGIRNTGSQDLLVTNHVAGKNSVGVIEDGQLWFQFDDGQQAKWELDPVIGRNWQRMIRNEANLNFVKPGEQVVATSRYGACFQNASAVGFNKVRAALLIEDHQYALSNWCDIKIQPGSLKDGAESMEIDYGSAYYKAPLYINELDGEKWVFIQNYRVSKIPQGTEPVFDVNKETSVLTITFRGGEYEPVTHDVRAIRTLGGPKELVPHVYLLRDMEKAMTSAAAVKGSKSVVQESGESHGSDEFDRLQDHSDVGSTSWSAWRYGLLLVILLVAAAVGVRWLKR